MSIRNNYIRSDAPSMKILFSVIEHKITGAYIQSLQRKDATVFIYTQRWQALRNSK